MPLPRPVNPLRRHRARLFQGLFEKWRNDQRQEIFSMDKAKIVGILCVFQDFLTLSSGKDPPFGRFGIFQTRPKQKRR
jgi:hypothetical protein